MPDHNHIHADMQGHGHGGSTDHPMRHGMVVFGHDTVFMSHLPMFSTAEHAYQVVLETELMGAAAHIYQDDRAKHPDVPFYTFNPKRFVLPGLLVTVDDRSNHKTERLQMSDHPAAAATIHDGGSSVSVKIEPVTEIYFNDDRDMQA